MSSKLKSREEQLATMRAILALAAIAMGWLVRLIINDDDFVARRTVGWTTAGLNSFLITTPRVICLTFDGGRVRNQGLFIWRYMDKSYMSRLSLSSWVGRAAAVLFYIPSSVGRCYERNSR
jgi:hypothetical protein